MKIKIKMRERVIRRRDRKERKGEIEIYVKVVVVEGVIGGNGDSFYGTSRQ